MKNVLFIMSLLVSSLSHAIELGEYSCLSQDQQIATEDGPFSLSLKEDLITLHGRLEYFITSSTSPFIETDLSEIEAEYTEYRKYRAYRVDSESIKIEIIEKPIGFDEMHGQTLFIKKSMTEFELQGVFHAPEGDETWSEWCAKKTLPVS